MCHTCQLSFAAGPDLEAMIEVQAEGHLSGCVSSTENPLVNVSHMVKPKVRGGRGAGRGGAEDPDRTRGEELGPWLQSVALGVWGIGGLGCGEAADNRGHWERQGPEGPTGNGEEAAAASRKDLGLDHGNSSGAGGD